MKLSHRFQTLNKWTIEAGRKRRVWQKSEINAVVKALQSANFASNKTADVADAYIELAQKTEYGSFEHSITQEQSVMGITYLRSRYFKKTGEPRKQCPFGSSEQRIIEQFKKFTFVGFYSETNEYGTYRSYVPVYRVYAHNGDYFDYSPIHWGTPIVHITRIAVSERKLRVQAAERERRSREQVRANKVFALIQGGKV